MQIFRAIAILMSGGFAYWVQEGYVHPISYVDHSAWLLVCAAFFSFFFFCMVATQRLVIRPIFNIVCLVVGILATALLARLVHNGDLRSLAFIDLFLLILGFASALTWIFVDPPWGENDTTLA